ncbi:MAG TPA: NUDIX hydrolase [Anaerolineae bacterium]|jgi:8-oxo-dGTP diphosphatase|nr:NUDIX hydrolase [Anaerolineae bacterium]
MPINLNVNVVIFSLCEDALQVLLAPKAEKTWALPEKSVAADESLESAALGAFSRLAHSPEIYLEQLYTYGDPERIPGQRAVSVVYFALIPLDARGAQLENMQWQRLDKLPGLANDHAEMISYALRRLRYKLEYSAVGFELLPDEFTLSELQHTYEIILGEKLDKRNFRRRILEAGIIEATPHRRSGDGRPAQLYRYRPDAVAEVKARRLFP